MCGIFSRKSRKQKGANAEKPVPLARSVDAPAPVELSIKPGVPETPPPAYGAGVLSTEPYNPPFAQIAENSAHNINHHPEIQPFPPQTYPPHQAYNQLPQPQFQAYQPQAYQHPPTSSFSPTIEPITKRFSFRQNAAVGIDHYAALRQFDTVFLIDDSGSMIGPNWRQTSAALEAIVPICTAHDADGVDIYFLNSPRAHTQIRSSTEVLEIFSAVRPCGATPTGRRLGEILELYLQAFRANRDIKPLNIIVITDGEPTDPAKLKRSIIDCAKSLDALGARDRQVGVQFFQVGNDEAATESLEELDNSLVEEENVRDMVDTISWKNMNEGKGLSADGILKAVMGAVDKRLDRTQRAV